MPIPVSCQCGYQVDAPDHYAGQQVTCPQCQQPLAVPAASATAGTDLGGALEGLGIEAGSGGFPCPHCLDAEIPPGGIICIACGYNAETGMLMGEAKAIQKKAFGAATYTHRSYGNEQLDIAAEQMEKELQEINSEGGLPYWFWLFVFFNVISFGLGLAMCSLTYFSLSGETLKIASLRGQGVTQLERDAQFDPGKKDLLYLLVNEAEISNTPSPPQKDDSGTGTTMTRKAKPGTFVFKLDEQNGFFRYDPVADQANSGPAGWVPSSGVVRVSRAQVELIILGNKPDVPQELRPITEEGWYALFKGLGSYCTIEFYIGLLYYTICHISIASWAVKDETTQAILACAIPGYNMIWAFMRRKYVGGLGVMAMLALTMIFGALIIESFVPDLLPTVAGSPSK
ncbi:MAG: hypothetical protein CMJ76_02880 [Planctomycetaceae bacterium]|nr:hypothetical protein [Planctomycetaceae bacterium]|tara:strand:+ start:258 stop:1454 length:1197 start_codon:yes stop_codon:yes gene_type:complete